MTVGRVRREKGEREREQEIGIRNMTTTEKFIAKWRVVFPPAI